MKPTLSIIIVNWNTQDLIKQCLETINSKDKRLDLSTKIIDPANSESIPTEIIIVDNGSTDGSVEFIKNFQKTNSKKQTNLNPSVAGPKIKLIENRENLGFAKANNQGIKKARGEYILLLNSDIIVPEAAISQTLFWLSSHPEAAACACKLLNKDKTDQSSCGTFPDLLTTFLMLFLEKLFGSNRVRTSGDKIKQVDWLMGAFIMTRKWVFEEIGGLDENIFMYMEEVEWFYRLHKAGLSAYFYPNAKVIHLGGGSSKTGRSEPILNIYKGLIYFYKKHKPNWQLKIVKLMLKTKARLSFLFGKITHNDYLIDTYEKAFKLV